METQNNIFKIENTGLLNSLAFIALPEGRVHVYLDPADRVNVSGCNHEVFSPNFFIDQTWQKTQCYKHKIVYEVDDLLVHIEKLIDSNHIPNELKEILLYKSNNLDADLFDQYKKSFDSIMTEIKCGKLQKAVPTLAIQVPFRIGFLHKFIILKNILLSLKMGLQAYGYGYWNSKNEGVIGITPEVLYEKKSEVYTTMALAGTLPWSGDTASEDLLNDAKNRIEHEFVVKDISDKLKKIKANVKIDKTSTLKFRSLLHLKTGLEFTFKNQEGPNCKTLIENLHPTAALGVFSNSYDFLWLKKLPCQLNRKKFGAPIFFKIDDNHEIALVTLRNIQWTDSTVTLEAGGGVVAESAFEDELTELQKKRNVTIDLILGAK